MDGYKTPPTAIEVDDSEDDEFDWNQDEQRPIKVLVVDARDGKFKPQQERCNDAGRKSADLSEPDG